MSRTTDAARLNSLLAKHLPELNNEYARYPMKRDAWLSPDGTAPDGQPLFIASPTFAGFKQQYVYCNNSQFKWGKGYYHVLTKQAYVHLYNVNHNKVGGTCCSSAEDRELDEVVRLVKCRAWGSLPNDLTSRKESDAIY